MSLTEPEPEPEPSAGAEPTADLPSVAPQLRTLRRRASLTLEAAARAAGLWHRVLSHRSVMHLVRSVLRWGRQPSPQRSE